MSSIHWAGLSPWVNFFLFYCLFLRERESTGEEERERETEDPKQALRWQQRAQCGVQTHELWDHDLSWSWMLNQLSHPGAPFPQNFKGLTPLFSTFQDYLPVWSLELCKQSGWFLCFFPLKILSLCLWIWNSTICFAMGLFSSSVSVTYALYGEEIGSQNLTARSFS